MKKSLLETFEGRYKKFIELVNPLVGVRGKRMNITELKYCIEELYSIRFINDSNKENDEVDFPFPNFVLEFLNNKYMKKPSVDQHALDLILSIDFFKTKDIIIDIFSKFLNEELDKDDLEFYLYVRFCIEKELNKTFVEITRLQNKKGKITEEEKEANSLSVKSCLNLANNIYGEEQEELLNNFMSKIEEILTQQKNKGTKKNLIDTEQILKITQEKDVENTNEIIIKENWSKEGNIEFINYCASYRPNTPIILKNINLKIEKGEKIGIVGRTGSGKSSLINALARIIEPKSGKIMIDNVDIQSISLKLLREKISILPQEIFLIESNLRDNIDPLKINTDNDILNLVNDLYLFKNI